MSQRVQVDFAPVSREKAAELVVHHLAMAAGLFQADLSAQMRDQLGRPDSLGRGQFGMPGVEIGAGFVQGSLGNHQVKAAFDPRGEPVFGRVKQDRKGLIQGQKRRRGVVLPIGNAAPGGS